MDALKAMKLSSAEPGSPPSPAQALLGGLTAGVIAIILYKFATTIEAALNRQTISDNFSVRFCICFYFRCFQIVFCVLVLSCLDENLIELLAF